MKQGIDKLIGGILGTVVAPVVVAIVVWKLEPLFKDNPAERKALSTATASAPASFRPAKQSPSGASIPPGSASNSTSTSQAGRSHYINGAALSGHKTTTPVAIKGSADVSSVVLDALAVPLQRGVFTRAFFSDGVFDRALNGEGNGIALLNLPKEINKVVLLQVGESQRTSIPDAPGAIKVRRHVAITVMEAQSGAVIKAAKFVAEGSGFDEEFVDRSLKEDLAAKLEPVRRAL
jgi:hypothetical protein